MNSYYLGVSAPKPALGRENNCCVQPRGSDCPPLACEWSTDRGKPLMMLARAPYLSVDG